MKTVHVSVLSFFFSCAAKTIQIVEKMFSGEENNVLDKEIP